MSASGRPFNMIHPDRDPMTFSAVMKIMPKKQLIG